MNGNSRIILGVVLFALGAFCVYVLNKTDALGYSGGALCIVGVLVGTNGWDARVEAMKAQKNNPVETSKKLELKRERKVQ